MQERLDGKSQPGEWIENNFIVPYQENKQFIGRDELLQKLRETFLDQKPLRNNHRVALHGMGGIGKTQTALAYAFKHRNDYGSVYWITADDEATLLMGYDNIAKNGRIPMPKDSSPADIAKIVISWLQRTQNWLLIIDNLDDITTANGYLPENSFTNHNADNDKGFKCKRNTSCRIRNSSSRTIEFGGAFIIPFKYRHH